MFIIKKTTIEPGYTVNKSLYSTGKTYPEKKTECFYFGETYGGLFSGFKSSLVFSDYLSAARKVSELTQSWAEEISKRIEDRTRYPESYLKDQRMESVTYSVVDLREIPAPDSFNQANSFDIIPDLDRDVEIIYRNGERDGVVTNFLRDEMLKGNYKTLNNQKARWRYVEDSLFLTYKKAGFHK